MSDEQDVAEELDPDELGDDPEGSLEFPAEGYAGATDPGQDDEVTDSYRTRSLRESVPEEDDKVDEPAIRLSSPADVWDDGEAEAVGDAIEVDDASAEEAAVHVVDENDPDDSDADESGQWR
jgi:hypothetical protein